MKMPVEKVVARGGGISALARSCGVSRQVVGEWKRRGQIPAHRVAAVSAATGVPAEAIRPDIFRIHRAPSGAIRRRAQGAAAPQ